MTSPRPLIALAIALSLTMPALAQAPARTHDIELDDYFSLAIITSCVLSPDGTRVAYTEMRWEKENDARNTDLWIAWNKNLRKTPNLSLASRT